MSLLFVYNANSGKINAILDAGHKLLSPSTYQCHLCALTYDTFTENKTWKAFRKDMDIDMVFYHKDEFESCHPNTMIDYPAVLKLDGNQLVTLLDMNALNKLPNTLSLIDKLKAIL